MSELLEINGESFIPSKIAAKKAGYTSDYVARLAREKKIAASKVGKTWFVSEKSLQKFIQEAEGEKLRRRQELSEERREEQKKFVPVMKEHERPISTEGKFLALAQTVAILALGIFAGTSGYFVSTDQVATVQKPSAEFLETTALRFYEFVSGDRTYDRIAFQHEFVPVPPPEEVVEEEVSNRDDVKGGGFGRSILSSIEKLFSDDVEVIADDENPGAVIVIPRGEDGADEEHRFVMFLVSDGEVSDEILNTEAGANDNENK